MVEGFGSFRVLSVRREGVSPTAPGASLRGDYREDLCGDTRGSLHDRPSRSPRPPAKPIEIDAVAKSVADAGAGPGRLGRWSGLAYRAPTCASARSTPRGLGGPNAGIAVRSATRNPTLAVPPGGSGQKSEDQSRSPSGLFRSGRNQSCTPAVSICPGREQSCHRSVFARQRSTLRGVEMRSNGWKVGGVRDPTPGRC